MQIKYVPNIIAPIHQRELLSAGFTHHKTSDAIKAEKIVEVKRALVIFLVSLFAI